MNATVRLYRALGNETRLAIVQELARRGHEVQGTKIIRSCSGALGLAQPTLSQHFARLVECGALVERKQGTEKFYRLNAQVFNRAGINVAMWEEK